jgi:hypothetical protein
VPLLHEVSLRYPQAEYPYARLVEENQRRNGKGFEYELLDSGAFDEDRYFDVFIEYAKVDPEDLCVRIEAVNRGPDPAPLHVLPQLWFRNTWAWGPGGWRHDPGREPVIRPGPDGPGFVSVVADDSAADMLPGLPLTYRLGPRTLYAPAGGEALFTFNETNGPRVFGPGAESRRPHVKAAFHRQVVNGEDCVNPDRVGTKAAFHYAFPAVPPGGSVVVRLRLTDRPPAGDPLADVDAVTAARRAEADEFYAAIHPRGASADERLVQRQAFAGLLRAKQNYIFDV